MTRLMSDEAVYRTAPATPGLLKIHFFVVSVRLTAQTAIFLCVCASAGGKSVSR